MIDCYSRSVVAELTELTFVLESGGKRSVAVGLTEFAFVLESGNRLRFPHV